jgi:hypothetical protein
MPPPFIDPHYNRFAEIPFQPQGALGKSPSQWVADLNLQDVPDVAQLPQQPLDRAGVREICRNPNKPVLFGYVCAMCWGWQEKGPRGNQGVTDPWQEREKIARHLETLRAGNLTRSEAYSLFRGEGKVSGLGPSYFTKLLFFFSPAEDFWIMDQWTGKSINLLTGEIVVRFNGASPSDKNKGGNYQAYCEEVDALAGLLKVSGDEIEQRLMSKGKPNPWPWRMHILEHTDYNKARMTARYRHILDNEL